MDTSTAQGTLRTAYQHIAGEDLVVFLGDYVLSSR